jgi:hypothetical protein
MVDEVILAKAAIFAAAQAQPAGKFESCGELAARRD